MSTKQRKRLEKKLASLAASQPRKVPLHEQSIDITPAGSHTKTNATADLRPAMDSLKARAEITKSARVARRKSIREANFLRGL
jgi:large subunit ribosomal protein L54